MFYKKRLQQRKDMVTHEHYDHVGGLDDLRPFGRFADIPIYSDAPTSCR